jgi:hypothetical protein
LLVLKELQMTTRTYIDDEGTAALAGALVPSSRSAWAETSNVIPFTPRSAAASPWVEDEDADCFEMIGVLACRLVGSFDLPRILVWSAPEDREDNPPEL